MTTKKSKPLRDRIANALTGDNSTGLDADLIRELAALLAETNLSEIEIESGGAHIRVARGTVAAALAPVTGPVQTTPAPATAAPHGVPPEPAVRKGTIVTSPMVGTVYLAAQPGAPPFVKVGDAVTDGTLCIIEAMKTMNPVPAPVAGHVAEIFVHDGQPVEFGEPLMRIE
jgi:acetyl-CoA carboxylase biotin carboxyl carrier protein